MRIITILLLYIFSMYIIMSDNTGMQNANNIKGVENKEAHEVITVSNTDKEYREELKEIAALNAELVKMCEYDSKKGDIECD